MNSRPEATALQFVTAVSDWDVFSARLARSDCLKQGRYPLHLQWNAKSAAEVFNACMDHTGASGWWVWVHQDVVLPPFWDTQFLSAVAHAESIFDRLDVVGLYGVRGAGSAAVRVGHLLDRGEMLCEAESMPSLVDSLDEFLFAVRAGSPLRLDPALKFDFYATDLVLQAQQGGFQAAVVSACCEHWSGTPRTPPFSEGLLARVRDSGQKFEAKWASRLPVTTPIVHIDRVGDVDQQHDRLSRPIA